MTRWLLMGCMALALSACQAPMQKSPLDSALVEGRSVPAKELQELVVGRTLTGINQAGALTVSLGRDGIMTLAKDGGESESASYQITDEGRLCNKFGKGSCQTAVLSADGKTLSFYDEGGQWRSTFPLREL
jgi:hypothetical protein